MLGFNKIVQVQPGRQVSTPSRSQQLATRTPLGVSSENNRNYQSTPLKRTADVEGQSQGPTSKNQRADFVTPVRRPFLDVQNAPIKKRSIDSRPSAEMSESSKNQNSYLAIREKRAIPDDSIETYSQAFEEDLFPANQQGLYEDGYGDQIELDDTPADNPNPAPTTSSKGKVGFERVNEETVEMGGFVLPGSEKKMVHKSYNWIAGRADGQYRVVLGYNTLFKVKNAVDSTTGEKDFNRWRVVRFENRYKENYPYTEFPAKYLEPLIQALEKAREQHLLELKEEAVTPN